LHQHPEAERLNKEEAIDISLNWQAGDKMPA
jgi:hypothetical protein